MLKSSFDNRAEHTGQDQKQNIWFKFTTNEKKSVFPKAQDDILKCLVLSTKKTENIHF